MRYMVTITLLAAVLGGPAAAAGQSVPRPPEHPTGRLVAGGLLGGGLGVVALGFTGGMIGANSCIDEGNPDSCRALEGVLIGASAGATLGIPLGVHLANGRAGNLGTSMLVSAGIAGLGAAIGFGSGNDTVLGAMAVTVPVAQLISSIAVERATARRRRG